MVDTAQYTAQSNPGLPVLRCRLKTTRAFVEGKVSMTVEHRLRRSSADGGLVKSGALSG